MEPAVQLLWFFMLWFVIFRVNENIKNLTDVVKKAQKSEEANCKAIIELLTNLYDHEMGKWR